ncbi:MAG: hypothetical protein ACK57F_07680 [Pseudomonadota bacterium]
MFKLRNQPGWESRDPAERARAIACADPAAIAPRLADLARGDESPTVRAAAVRRLVDLPLLGDRARHDADATVRELAAARYRALLCDEAMALPERERILRAEDDADVLAHVASQAPEPTLRLLALERHGKPGLLAERCQRDPDPALRLTLLARIDHLPTLDRLAESARKSDKRLAHAARERAFAMRLAAGDPQARRERALAIADCLDALRRERPQDLLARRDMLLDEWSALAPHLGDDLVRRVQGYVDALAGALAPRTVSAGPAVTPAPLEDEVLPDPAPDPELLALADEAEGHAGILDGAGVDELRRRLALAWDRRRSHAAAELDARQRFEAALALARERLNHEAARRDAEADARRAALELDAARARDALAALEAALDAERAGDARDAQATLVALRAARLLPATVDRRLAALQERFDRLARWQHWSNNKARARLCDEIESLAASGAHPDAIAHRVREGQTEWQRLDASERLDAEAAARVGLARRFRAVCHRAMAPARAYFDKRDELRGRRRADLDALLARADGVHHDAAHADSGLRRALTEALHRLDDIDPRERGALGKRLRAAIERIDARRADRDAAAEADKRKVIAQLRRQLAQVSGPDALAAVREAQTRLASMPRAGRAAEEALRSEFSALADPLFAAERAQREGEQSAAREREAAVAEVLRELAALANGDAESLRHADARIAALQARWHAIAAPPAAKDDRDRGRGARDGRGGPAPGRRDDRVPPGQRDRRPPRDDRRRDEERRFDQSLDQVRRAQRALQARLRAETTQRILAAAAACAAAEAALIDGDAAPSLDALQASIEGLALPAVLRQRIERVRGWITSGIATDALMALAGDARAAGAALAVRAEAARGAESPAEARELRRALQMQRLAERMRGGAATDPAQDAKQLLEEWLGLGPLPAADRSALAARIEPSLTA